MKNDKFHKYLYWGATVFVVLALVVVLIFLLINEASVKALFGLISSILMPIIYGAVLAYLLTPVFNWVRGLVDKGLEKTVKTVKTRKRIARATAMMASILMLVVIVFGLILMLIPQLISSLVGIVEAMPTSVRNLQLWLEQMLVDNPELEAMVMPYYDTAVNYLQDWVSKVVVPNLSNIIGGLSMGVYNMLIALKNVLIGVIVMVYLLNMKEKLITQAKMIVYSAFPLKVANKVVEEVRYTHKVFGGFIIGKLVDSLIIGLMCFVLLSLMNMPYVLLVSVIIGVTNVIPFFGPFIGAVPAAFLILLVSPIKCLYFIGFIFLLQQFDGNVLGPKILGDTTGISSFWVLFSILLFGGLFGFIGMIIGVPTFAVLYRLLTELVTYLLEKKNLSQDIGHYENLNYIEEETKSYIKNERAE